MIDPNALATWANAITAARLALSPLMFLVMLVFPIWVAPMFNDFGPMQDKQLEAEILALADRCRRVGGPSPCCGTPTPSPILLDGTSTSAAWTI